VTIFVYIVTSDQFWNADTLELIKSSKAFPMKKVKMRLKLNRQWNPN